ncbi:7-cyano-7-deazaguanine synthase QueC [Candidatus Magnetomonas plexicatena]|uniref:7-cyano-7-deazaguanine synthase QueC n=1 Tax=Candidatus Magnetomonas plexicatena TaxID=2552947 RepID=UPI001C780B49|nr:7-cyano-7-deazaguanine synthase QueC [Nitrospirales bacterium LBB_01]
MKKAVVLLSGGVDSSTTLAVAASEGYDVHALSFDYGQRHKIELQFSGRIAAQFKVKKHTVLTFDLREIGGSALTSDIEVPKGNSHSKSIPITYVPARNTIFLSFALALAEATGAADIFIGANAVDYSGYPDCRPEYLRAFEAMANLATKAGVEHSAKFKIHAPLIYLSKAEIIKLGTSLGVDFALTLSCYDPGPTGTPCKECQSCIIRAKGFKEAAIVDPCIAEH